VRRLLKILLGVVLLLAGLYPVFSAVVGAVLFSDPFALLLLIPGGALIAVAIAVLQWARE